MNATPPPSSYVHPEPMGDDRTIRPDDGPLERALVIAGGGAAGNAWALGIIAGLAEAGVDLSSADLVVGTSSGSTVAAQVTGDRTPAEWYASILSEPPQRRPGSRHAEPGSAPRPAERRAAPRGPASGVSGQSYLDWSNAVIAASSDPADMRRRIGAAALARAEAEGRSEGPNRWREIVAARLPGAQWPQRRMLITAVNARSGEPVLFDRHCGVELIDAVAASTSAMIPYPIGEQRYLNGSYRRGENADLAAGYARVVVLVPFGGRTRTPLAWGMDLATQVAELRASGSRVETVLPDERTRELFDANALDPATRLPAARGGHAQGRSISTRIADLWA